MTNREYAESQGLHFNDVQGLDEELNDDFIEFCKIVNKIRENLKIMEDIEHDNNF